MVGRMRRFFTEHGAFMAAAAFSETQTVGSRYYSDNGVFPAGDAAVLRAMINALKPHRIIEIGSGFSTACMLDAIDELGLSTKVTCIEPYADRLRGLLRRGDAPEILEKPVQQVELTRFSELQDGDILFIDSTHVLKTGSDIHYELFEVLPSLNPGVVVHFHDLPYPFEYPSQWVFEQNYSWNEAYGVRAFLTYNLVFRPLYSNSLMATYEPDLLRSLFPKFPDNPGGAIIHICG